MSIDTSIHPASTLFSDLPSNMDDADWRSFHKLNRIELDHEPRSITDRLGISPVTIRRMLGESETRVADNNRQLRYKSKTYKAHPCQYVVGKTDTDGEDKRHKVVEYYDGDKVRPGFKPQPMEVDRGNIGWEDAFYEAVGLGGDQHRFSVVDDEPYKDEVATMSYDHKTGGVIAVFSRAVIKRVRRRNYGTCLSSISPYRS